MWHIESVRTQAFVWHVYCLPVYLYVCVNYNLMSINKWQSRLCVCLTLRSSAQSQFNPNTLQLQSPKHECALSFYLARLQLYKLGLSPLDYYSLLSTVVRCTLYIIYSLSFFISLSLSPPLQLLSLYRVVVWWCQRHISATLDCVTVVCWEGGRKSGREVAFVFNLFLYIILYCSTSISVV